MMDEANPRLNAEEFELRRVDLRSTPRRVTLGTHNSCNARCTFCLEGSYSRFSLREYREFFERRMGDFIRGAEEVTFTGFGELLWIPGIEEFLDYVNASLPDTWKAITTNGTPLRPAVLSRLLTGKYIIQVSLHASHADLHRRLTRLEGQFDAILRSVETLARERSRRGLRDRLHVQLVSCLTTGNIDDLPEFLKLGWRLGAQETRASYMTMFAPEHIEQSCYFQQERAGSALDRAWEVARLLATARDAAGLPSREFVSRLPPRFGDRAGEGSAGACPEPWSHVYVELQGGVAPCCEWGDHIGNLREGAELGALWNGETYRDLRERMGSGAPHPWCARCVRYRGYNVNDLSCHLTTRPEARARLLEEIGRRGLLQACPA